MNAILFCCGLALTTATPKELTVEVRVCKGDPLGSGDAVRYLAESGTTIPSGKSVQLRAGGEVPIVMDGGKVHYVFLGTEVDVCVIMHANGRVFTETNINYAPHDFGNKNNALNGGSGTRISREGKLGEAFRHRVSANAANDQVWVEVTVRAAGATRP